MEKVLASRDSEDTAEACLVEIQVAKRPTSSPSLAALQERRHATSSHINRRRFGGYSKVAQRAAGIRPGDRRRRHGGKRQSGFGPDSRGQTGSDYARHRNARNERTGNLSR